MVTDPHALLRKYAKQKDDVELRNEIVLAYMHIVKIVAVSLRNAYAKYGEFDDVVNEGVIALINSVETFDIERGVKFETYASVKVKGAVIDYVRKQDWVPRQVRQLGKAIEEAYAYLYIKLGRYPKNREVADYLEISMEKLARAMADIAGAVTLSFEELIYEDNFSDTAFAPEADYGIYEEEKKKVLTQAINSLKPKQKQVITLYYYEKLKFLEIAKVLGVTESRVSQIHAKSVLILKHKLEAYMKM
ncbi:MAG: FliA/WhiG family RNA polymerase sigma factor [Oscillospiraceae bacterium]|nr:FliA/WhiG family RNA polymerase sigma factor [Oscillospiraceae bacterium]